MSNTCSQIPPQRGNSAVLEPPLAAHLQDEHVPHVRPGVVPGHRHGVLASDRRDLGLAQGVVSEGVVSTNRALQVVCVATVMFALLCNACAVILKPPPMRQPRTQVPRDVIRMRAECADALHGSELRGTAPCVAGSRSLQECPLVHRTASAAMLNYKIQ